MGFRLLCKYFDITAGLCFVQIGDKVWKCGIFSAILLGLFGFGNDCLVYDSPGGVGACHFSS